VDTSGFGTGVLIVGAVAFLVGILGCLTCKCKKVCFTLPFIILTLIIGLVLLILGLLLLGAASTLVD
jgi:tetrahydromethanopterin S-methyltransferase subunit C